jgi:hypothetical protein
MQTTAKPVEFPDNKHVTGPKSLEATQESGALGRHSCDPFVLEDVRTSGTFQRGKL